MFQIKKKFALPVGAAFFVLTFVLFYFSFVYLLDNDFIGTYLITYSLFSLLVGVIASCLVFFQMKIGFLIFTIGYIAGAGTMISSLSQPQEGFGELAGLLSFMFLLGAGLAAAILVEIILLIFKKVKKA